MDKKYLLTAFGYFLLGLLLGIFMAISEDHTQLVTHAHIMLLGFVVSFIYATCYKVWLLEQNKLAAIQYYCHQFGVLVLLIGLFLLYGKFVSEHIVGPIMGLASIAVLCSAVLMKIQIIKLNKKTV